jgi:hypothetical protein
MIEIGDRVRYNLSTDYPWFWNKEGTVIDKCRKSHLITVLFDEPIYNMGSYFDGDTQIEMGKGCFEIIEKREPDWEI